MCMFRFDSQNKICTEFLVSAVIYLSACKYGCHSIVCIFDVANTNCIFVESGNVTIFEFRL